MDRSELQAMGERGQEFYRTELSLQTGTRRFLEIFEQVTSGRSRSPGGSDPESSDPVR